jgi:hypothetical protein
LSFAQTPEEEKNNLKRKILNFFFSLSLSFSFLFFLCMTTRVKKEKVKTKNEWLLSCCNIQTNLDKKNEMTSLTRRREEEKVK